jgi:hypothetical protein
MPQALPIDMRCQSDASSYSRKSWSPNHPLLLLAVKYQSLEQKALEADVYRGIGMSRGERLERWAELLDRQPNRRLSTIGGTEFGSRRGREAKHTDNSPLTVTFEDPVACVMRRSGAIGLATGSCGGPRLPPRLARSFNVRSSGGPPR